MGRFAPHCVTTEHIVGMGGIFVKRIAGVAKRYDVSEAFPGPSPSPHPSLSSHHGAVTVNGREELVPDIGLFWKIACKC